MKVSFEKNSNKLSSHSTNAMDKRSKLFEIQIWTVEDVASYLKVSKGTIYNWKYIHNDFPFHQKGKRGRLYFIPSEILEWIKEGEFR